MARTLHTKELLLLHGTISTEVCAVGVNVRGCVGGANLDWVRKAFRQIDRPKQNRASGDTLCAVGTVKRPGGRR